MLEDVGQMRGYIDSRLRVGVTIAEDDQLLNGSGVAPDVEGFRNRTGLAAAIARDAAGGESNADAIARQISAIRVATSMEPDGIVMNPVNWAVIETSKSDGGDYLAGGPFSVLPQRRLWGLPVADGGILGECCEPRFAKWDTYGQELLREDAAGWEPVALGDQVIAYEGSNYNYSLLKLFVLSVLWRASVSSLSFFRRVNLGPHESRVLEMLRTDSPGGSDTYAVVLAKYVDPPVRAILDPYGTRFDGRNYYQFSLGSFLAYVKVDQRPALYPLRNVQLAPDRPLVVLGREMRRAKDLQVVRDIANSPQNSRFFR